jgi:hypothetical protein
MKSIISIFVIIPFFILGCKDSTTQSITVSTLTKGLLAYYPFNGNANDNSGKDSNGVVYGTTLASDRFGKSNSAYHFTGGAYIRIPELFSDTVSAFTWAVWAMQDTIDNNNHEILYKGIEKGQVSMGITRLLSNPVMGFGVCLGNNRNNWYSVNIPDTLKARTYYFFVGRYTKGQKVELLLNGNLVASTSIPDLPLYQVAGNPNNYSAIGTVPIVPAYYWVGIIDDIRIYNRALSDDEVQSLYHEGGWTGN